VLLIETSEFEMRIKNIGSKARYLAIGLIALEIASIPVSAKIIDTVAFSKPQKVIMATFPPQTGVTKFLVSSDAPFAIISEGAMGAFDVNIKVSGILNGQRFGSNAQMPGPVEACAVQTSREKTKIYEAERKTELREGGILTRAVIVEIHYDSEIKPEFKIISQNKAKKFPTAVACVIKPA